MTEQNTAIAAKPLTVVQQLMRDVSDNPSNLKWPRDTWGFTTNLKKEVLLAAGAIRGNSDKHDLLLNTLAVAIAHIQKRRAKDMRAVNLSRAANRQATDERIPRQRVSARATPAE